MSEQNENSERITVLELLRNGKISVDEAEARLQAADIPALTEPDDHRAIFLPGDDRATYSDDLPDASKMWLYPFGAGMSSLTLAGLFLRRRGFFGTLLAAPVMMSALGMALVGLFSKDMHWIHVRVKEGSTNLRFSLPFPLRIAGSVLSMVEPAINVQTNDKQISLRGMNIAELVQEMDEVISRENPLLVAVDEGDTQVLVYIT